MRRARFIRVSDRGGERLDVPCVMRCLASCSMTLYGPGRIFYTPRGRRVIARDRRRSGVHWSVWRRDIGLPPQARGRSGGCFTPCRITGQGAVHSKRCTSKRQTVSVRVYIPNITPGSRSGSQEARVVAILRHLRILSSRMSVRSATILVSFNRLKLQIRKARCRPFRQDARKVRNIQMETMRFSNGRDAWTYDKRAFSMKRKPLESLAPACGMWTSKRLDHSPQRTKQKSGLLMCYQIRPVN